LFVGTCIIPASAQYSEQTVSTSRGKWLYVGGNGPGNYTKIQDAINASSDGDTVFVYSGIYPEWVRIETSIRLIGEDKNTTIIEGGWGYGVKIKTDAVLVTGFTIQNCGSYYCGGITLGSDNNTILGNILINNIIGGVYVYGDNNTIANNSIIDNNNRGISINDGCYNTMSGNIIEANNRGIVFVEIRDDDNPISDNAIIGNIIKNNEEGIFIQRGTNTLISNNFITSNRYAIVIGFVPPLDTNSTVIESNTVIHNTYGLYIFDSNNSHIYHNNFIENTNQAFEEFYEYPGINYWDNGYSSGGNYWSDYNGSDDYSGPSQDIPGSDGIGDTPYIITGYGTHNKDHYPLMHPYGPHPELSVSGHGGLGVTLTMTNTGTSNALDVQWNASVTGGFFGRIHVSGNGSRDILEIGGSTSLSLTPFGIGPLKIDIEVIASNMEKQSFRGRGFLILFMVFPVVPPLPSSYRGN
jgi:parallel beta-helix repeat protein